MIIYLSCFLFFWDISFILDFVLRCFMMPTLPEFIFSYHIIYRQVIVASMVERQMQLIIIQLRLRS